MHFSMESICKHRLDKSNLLLKWFIFHLLAGNFIATMASAWWMLLFFHTNTSYTRSPAYPFIYLADSNKCNSRQLVHDFGFIQLPFTNNTHIIFFYTAMLFISFYIKWSHKLSAKQSGTCVSHCRWKWNVLSQLCGANACETCHVSNILAECCCCYYFFLLLSPCLPTPFYIDAIAKIYLKEEVEYYP